MNLPAPGSSVPSAASGQYKAASTPCGLARPLFQRLQACGYAPVLLRHQYRCHPELSRIPNAQYYGGRLLDGCTEEQRAGLVTGLPPLTFVNVRCAPQLTRLTDGETSSRSAFRGFGL